MQRVLSRVVLAGALAFGSVILTAAQRGNPLVQLDGQSVDQLIAAFMPAPIGQFCCRHPDAVFSQ